LIIDYAITPCHYWLIFIIHYYWLDILITPLRHFAITLMTLRHYPLIAIATHWLDIH
jgi:hypothetical protein